MRCPNLPLDTRSLLACPTFGTGSTLKSEAKKMAATIFRLSPPGENHFQKWKMISIIRTTTNAISSICFPALERHGRRRFRISFIRRFPWAGFETRSEEPHQMEHCACVSGGTATSAVIR
jgi:hypothetical protein